MNEVSQAERDDMHAFGTRLRGEFAGMAANTVVVVVALSADSTHCHTPSQ